MNEAMKKVGVPTQLYVARGMGHGRGALPPMDLAIAFLDANLKKK